MRAVHRLTSGHKKNRPQKGAGSSVELQNGD